MTTPKARYVGSGAGTTLQKSFSDELKRSLRNAYLRRHAKSRGRLEANGTAPGARSDEFASDVLLSAQWAIAAMHWDKYEISGREVRTELADLCRTLQAAV